MLCLTAMTAVAQNYDAWEAVDSMPIPVAGAQAVLHQNRVTILGGYADSSKAPIDAIQMYNPDAPQGQRWQIVGHLQVPRANFNAQLHQDRIIILGGKTGFDGKNITAIEEYAFGDSSVIIGEDIKTARIAAAAGMWNGSLMLFGGYNNQLAQLPFALQYDVANRSVLSEDTPSVFQGRTIPYQQAIVRFNNEFYLFGGVLTGISNVVMQYVPYTRQIFKYPGELDGPRTGSAALVSGDGKAIVIGGNNENQTVLGSVQAFDLQHWYAAPPKLPNLLNPRSESVAVYVPGNDRFSNRLLVFGGRDENGAMVGTVERLYFVEDSAATDVESRTPRTFRLRQNYPNPFNAGTTLEFELDSAQDVQLTVLNAHGRLVQQLVNQHLGAGTHRFTWQAESQNGRHLPSGVYLYQLTTETETLTRKMLLIQ